MSFEVDEIIPVSKGGSPIDRGNVAPAHRICNERRGNKPIHANKQNDKTGAVPGAGPRPCDLKTEDETRF